MAGNKFDLQGILDNVKSMISPDGSTVKAVDGDEVGEKLEHLSALVQKVATDHAQTAKDLAKINKLFASVYKDMQMFKAQVDGGDKSDDDVVTNADAKEPAKKPEDKQ